MGSRSSSAETAVEPSITAKDHQPPWPSIDPVQTKPHPVEAKRNVMSAIDEGRPLSSAKAATYQEPGTYGGALRSQPRSMEDHPGIRRYRSDLDRQRNQEGLFSLIQRHDTHSHDMGHHHEKDHSKGEPIDEDLIVFEGPNDPLNPQLWSLRKRLLQTLLLGMSTLVVTFASSVFSSGTQAIAAEFDIGLTVATLTTSLFVLGYAVGPVIWGPFSELYGRKTPIVISYFGFMIFQIPAAVAQNVQTVMLARFLGGLFASGPLAVVAGALSDFWSAEQRGGAIAIFALATFGGPAIGPVMGSFIVKSYLGWRWTAYITLIWAALMLALLVLFLQESYVPVLLQRKARRIRFTEKRWAVRSKLDETEFDFAAISETYLLKPFKMLVYEPALLLITIYIGSKDSGRLTLADGLLYLLFGAVPLEFSQRRGIEAGVSSLPFIAVFIGAAVACCIVFAFTPRYKFAARASVADLRSRALHASGQISVPRERLVPMMIGAVMFPIGLFWYSWTDVQYVSSPWSQIVALGVIACAILLLFLQAINWIVDTYLRSANSAIAANTIIRSFFGAGFPLFGKSPRPMFTNLDYAVAGSILGAIAVVLAPAPFLFYAFDAPLRKKSRYAHFQPAKPQDSESDPEKKT